MPKLIAILLSSLFIAGCADADKEITSTERSNLDMSWEDISITTREPPDFDLTDFLKPESLLTGRGLAQWFGSIFISNRYISSDILIERFQIEQPAAYISDKLLDDLRYYLDMSIGEGSPVEVSGNSIKSMTKTKISAPFLLDVELVNWGFTHYNGAAIDVKLKLIDVKNKKMIAKGRCSVSSAKLADDDDDNYSFYGQFKNDAESFKINLQDLSDHCFSDFKYRLLKLDQESNLN